MKNDLNYAVELIRKADGILITAGAGMSVDFWSARFSQRWWILECLSYV